VGSTPAGDPRGSTILAGHVDSASEGLGEVLGARGVPRLVLITCGGPFDQVRHGYRDNLVVYAVPA
jgi:hypothetical protein